MATALRRCVLSAPRSILRPISSRIATQPALYRIAAFSPRATAPRAFTTSILRPSAQAYAENASQPSSAYTTFESLDSVVTRQILDNINRMGLRDMTEVQSKTITASLQGVDMIGQAKTGTGKTIAFLLPMIERMIQTDRSILNPHNRARSDDIRGIVISPTRELAEQIAEEAKKLVAGTGIKVQLAVGGTQKNAFLKQILYQGCHLLVATPGRLYDLLSDPTSGVAAPKLAAFVLDEADRLLGIGFGPQIEEIKRALPDPDKTPRQNMMFSATISQEVVDLVRYTLKPGFEFVQCVDPHDNPTHENVKQHLVLVPNYENFLPGLIELVEREHKAGEQPGNRPFKAIVFCNTFAEIELYNEVVFRHFRSSNTFLPVSKMHSRLTQMQRSSTANRFRQAKTGIMFGTDVVARGMDFPGVTHVIQLGLPPSDPRPMYVHRVGRTARAGKEGDSWIFIPDSEARYASSVLAGMPLKDDRTLQSATVDMAAAGEIPAGANDLITAVREHCKRAPPGVLSQIYRQLQQALGGKHLRLSQRDIQDVVDRLSRLGWGLDQPPMAGRFPSSRDDSTGRGGSGFGRGGGSGFSRGGGSGFGRGEDALSSAAFGGQGRGSFGRGQGSFGGDRSFDRGGGRSSFGRGDRGRGGFGRSG